MVGSDRIYSAQAKRFRFFFSKSPTFGWETIALTPQVAVLANPFLALPFPATSP